MSEPATETREFSFDEYWRVLFSHAPLQRILDDFAHWDGLDAWLREREQCFVESLAMIKRQGRAQQVKEHCHAPA